jgi:acyl transferase domain-containing protein
VHDAGSFTDDNRYCIGALNLESACKVAYYRGLLAGRLAVTTSTPGSMLSVNLPADDVSAYVEKAFPKPRSHPEVTIACINSPINVTLSGTTDAIDQLEIQLRQDGIFAQKLNTGVAYHSPAMETLAAEYIKCMGHLEASDVHLRVPMVSTVTGNVITPHNLSQPEYWTSNLTSTVRFSDALQSVVSAISKVKLGAARSKVVFDLVEVGPHCALRRPCIDILERTPRKKELRYISTLYRQKSSLEGVLELVGKLFTYGYPVSVAEVNRQLRVENKDNNQFLVDAPHYPFNQSQKYWHESRTSYDYRMRPAVPRDVLGSRAQDWNPLEPKWRRFISVDELSWVGDHVVSYKHNSRY